jgi:hypothetical protein
LATCMLRGENNGQMKGLSGTCLRLHCRLHAMSWPMSLTPAEHASHASLSLYGGSSSCDASIDGATDGASSAAFMRRPFAVKRRMHGFQHLHCGRQLQRVIAMCPRRVLSACRNQLARSFNRPPKMHRRACCSEYSVCISIKC